MTVGHSDNLRAVRIVPKGALQRERAAQTSTIESGRVTPLRGFQSPHAVQMRRTTEDRVVNLCVGQRGLSKVRAAEVRADEQRSRQVSVAEIGLAQIRVAQIGAREISSIQFCTLHPRTGEHHADQSHRLIAHIRSALHLREICSFKVCTLEISHHSRAAQIRPGQIRVGHNGRKKTRPAQVGIDQNRLAQYRHVKIALAQFRIGQIGAPQIRAEKIGTGKIKT